jgi:hypothetical protein
MSKSGPRNRAPEGLVIPEHRYKHDAKTRAAMPRRDDSPLAGQAKARNQEDATDEGEEEAPDQEAAAPHNIGRCRAATSYRSVPQRATDAAEMPPGRGYQPGVNNPK